MSQDSEADIGADVGSTTHDRYFDEIRQSLSVALQPIVRVATGDLFAYEALARFGELRPEDVMARAEAVGRGIDLELICFGAAAQRWLDLPPNVHLSMNVSPEALRASYDYVDEWPDRGDGRILEVTEHTALHFEAIDNEIAELRRRGVLMAVDDVGTGYAGLLRLAAMRPDLVKVDKSIVTGVADSVVQAAVLESLVTYSHRIGARVIAEGVETEDDLLALARFDVDFAQGWFIGHPQVDPCPIAEHVVALCRRNRADVLARRQPVQGLADRARTLHEATSSMALATEFADLRLAVDAAARAIRVDSIAVSGLDVDGRLREVFASGSAADVTAYAVEKYPTTAWVLESGEIGEVHLSESQGDVAEQQLLRSLGAASLLIVPFVAAGTPVGILEFYQAVDRHWTMIDLEQARGLALHLSNAWERMADARPASFATQNT